MSDSNKSDHTYTLILCEIVVASVSLILFQKSEYQHVAHVSNAYETSEYMKRAAARIKNECRSTNTFTVSECSHAIEQSTRDAHRAQKDLKAQRYMTLLAFIMVI